MSNILEQANNIINNRSEEKERQYGPMGEGFERAAMIASGMSGKEWTAHDMFIAMVALKFSRQSYNFKEDNLLDAVAYIGAWQNYIDETGAINAKSEKTLLTENTRETFKEEIESDEEESSDSDFADQSFHGQEVVASSPYSEDLQKTHPRDFLNTLIDLGVKR